MERKKCRSVKIIFLVFSFLRKTHKQNFFVCVLPPPCNLSRQKFFFGTSQRKAEEWGEAKKRFSWKLFFLTKF